MTIVTENLPKLYCCKDYKNVTRDKKFFRGRFFVWFSAPVIFFLNYKKFFKPGARKFHFSKYKKLFMSGFFFTFRARKVTSWNIKYKKVPFPEV